MKWTATLLLSLSVVLTAAADRRRAVSPVGPPCAEAEIAAPFFANDLVTDADFLYFTDDLGGLYRIANGGGGPPTQLTQMNDGSIILSIVVDDQSVYFTTASGESFLSSIYSVPKSGGSPTLLATAVVTPVDLYGEGDYLYWNSAGTPTGGDFLADGAIERMKKDGTNRTTLASALSFPLGLALDGNNVLFGETGIALNDTSAGLRSVPKSGGAVTTILDGVPVLTIATTADTYVTGIVNILGGTILSISRKDTTVRTNLASDFGGIPIAMRIFGDQIYYYFLSDTDSIRALPLSGGDARIVKSDVFSTQEFAIDGCALFYGSINDNTGKGAVRRTPR